MQDAARSLALKEKGSREDVKYEMSCVTGRTLSARRTPPLHEDLGTLSRLPVR